MRASTVTLALGLTSMVAAAPLTADMGATTGAAAHVKRIHIPIISDLFGSDDDSTTTTTDPTNTNPTTGDGTGSDLESGSGDGTGSSSSSGGGGGLLSMFGLGR